LGNGQRRLCPGDCSAYDKKPSVVPMRAETRQC